MTNPIDIVNRLLRRNLRDGKLLEDLWDVLDEQDAIPPARPPVDPPPPPVRPPPVEPPTGRFDVVSAAAVVQ